jgi:hypothetical protein
MKWPEMGLFIIHGIPLRLSQPLTHVSKTRLIQRIKANTKVKAVPLRAMEALGGRRNTAATHS